MWRFGGHLLQRDWLNYIRVAHFRVLVSVWSLTPLNYFLLRLFFSLRLHSACLYLLLLSFHYHYPSPIFPRPRPPLPLLGKLVLADFGARLLEINNKGDGW